MLIIDVKMCAQYDSENIYYSLVYFINTKTKEAIILQ